MMRSSLPVLTAVPALVVFLAGCGQAADSPPAEAGSEAMAEAAGPVEDIAASRPDVVDVAFQNEFVRVLRFDLPPDAALPPHQGRQRVIYALTDYEVEWMEGEEPATRRSWSAGEVHRHGPGVHAVRNVGGTTASFVVFERLDSPLPEPSDHRHADQVPTGVRALLEDPALQVLEVELQPGEAQAMHPGGWRAIYSLTGYTIEWREGDEVGNRTWSAGDAHWHEPGPHAAENVGETTARWVIVAYGS
jgi:hypothetical protein